MVNIEGGNTGFSHEQVRSSQKDDSYNAEAYTHVQTETARRIFAEMSDDAKWGFVYQMREKYTPKQLIAMYHLSKEDITRYFPHGINDPRDSVTEETHP